MADSTPYDELDPPVVGLCRVVNEYGFGGLFTVSSCGGHEEPGHARPADEWYVTFQLELDGLRPTEEAWCSLEFLAWSLTHAEHVWLTPFARAPHFNGPATDLRFDIEGLRPHIEPDQVVEHLSELWRLFGAPAEGLEDLARELGVDLSEEE